MSERNCNVLWQAKVIGQNKEMNTETLWSAGECTCSYQTSCFSRG